jgi:hypothetical protein
MRDDQRGRIGGRDATGGERRQPRRAAHDLRRRRRDQLRAGRRRPRAQRVRPADKLQIRTAQGQRVDVFFDISEYFGRM